MFGAVADRDDVEMSLVVNEVENGVVECLLEVSVWCAMAWERSVDDL